VVDAAEEVFNTYGYYDASIVKITEAASVAQGTFYVYFRSKKEISMRSSPISIAVSPRHVRGGSRSNVASRGRTPWFCWVFPVHHGTPGALSGDSPSRIRVARGTRNHYEKVAEGYIAPLREAMDAGDVTPGIR